MEFGLIYAIIGALLAVTLGGIGSSIGVGLAGQTSAGVVTEHPEVASKAMILQLLPATQGIYGFLIAFIVMNKIGMVTGAMVPISTSVGVSILFASLPCAFVELVSAIYQGRVASSAINMLGRRPDLLGKGIVMTVMVETYAVLALLISFLMINGIALA